MTLSREQLDAIVKQRYEKHHLVRSDDDTDEVDDTHEHVAADLSSASLRNILSKVQRTEDQTPPTWDSDPTNRSRFVVIEPDQPNLADPIAPARRAVVISSDTEEVIAEQG